MFDSAGSIEESPIRHSKLWKTLFYLQFKIHAFTAWWVLLCFSDGFAPLTSTVSSLWQELISLICNGWSLTALIKKPWFLPVYSNEFGFSHQKTVSFSSSLILHISFTGRTPGFMIWEAKYVLRSPEKLKVFCYLRSLTATIAHQWN